MSHINWYAAEVKSHNEARVLRHLSQKMVPALLPLIEVIRRYRSRRAARLEALFPGYLFVWLAGMDRDPGGWNAVRWAPGVKSFVGLGGVPVPVPDPAIEAIKARLQEFGFVRPGLPFGSHDRVLVRRGPLAGLEAVFDRPLSGSGRVQVLMHLLGQERRVQVDVLDLELV